MQGGDIRVPGLVVVPFNYALNIVVQRVEVGAIWGPELLGPKYIHTCCRSAYSAPNGYYVWVFRLAGIHVAYQQLPF
jgi:hypothetical protein